MKKGISTACFYPMQTEMGLREIVSRGVGYAEVFLDTFSEVKQDFVRELRKIADEKGAEIISLHPFSSGFEPFMLFTEYERRFNDALNMHKYYFEAMNTLGAEIFVFHGDRIGSKNDNRMYFERFARLRDVGKEFGVVVAQENVERCKSRNLDFLCDMVKYLDNDVAIVLDNKQAFRSGVGLYEFLERLHDNIIHVHLSDNDEKCDCRALGSGSLDLECFLEQLTKFSYTGGIIIELYNELLSCNEEIFDSYKLLQKCDC